MKFIQSTILLFFAFFAFSQVSHTFNSSSSDYQITAEKTYKKISNSQTNLSTSEVGAPQLPVFSKRFVLPTGSTVTNIAVNNRNQTLLKNNILLYPTQPPQTWGSEQEFVPPNPTIYNSPMSYPINTVTKTADGVSQGYHIINLDICPFKYIPKQKKLYLYQIVDINIQYRIGNVEYTEKITQYRHELTREWVASQVENPELLNSVSKTAKTILSAPLETNKKVLHWKPSAYGDVPDYIIITNETLKPHFKTLATYKNERGIPTLVVSTEQIYPNYQGVDNAEKIRNYLKSAHKYWGSGLFILLGGDTKIIPGRIGAYDWGEKSPTDLYYSDVYKEGQPNYNWNENGNNLYGEGSDGLELKADNFIGRAPVKSEEEVSTFIKKIKDYENLTGVSDKSYINNMLFLGSYLGYNQNTNVGYPGGQRWHDNLANEPFLSNNTELKIWKIYDDHQGSESNPNYIGNEELNRENIINRMNNGVQKIGKFHLVSHYDHGGVYAIGASSKMKGEAIYREDVAALTNGNYHQIMYTTSCLSGKFDQDAFAEHYINNPNGGGVAILANSQSVAASDIGVNQDKKLLQSIYGNLSPNSYLIGIAFANARDVLYSEQRRKVLTLFGDPTMATWSAAPQNINLTVPASFTIDHSSVNTLTVGINALSEEAKVTLYKYNPLTDYPEVFSSKKILAGNTNAKFNLNPDTPGQILVKVTAKNYLPAQKEVNILMPQSHLYITGYTFTDSNGNGYIEQGESITLNINLKNSGGTAIDNVNTLLSSAPELASVTQANVNYTQSVAPGETIQLSGYTFKPLVNIGAEELPNFIEFHLNISGSGNYTHLDNFYLDLHSPSLSLGARNLTNNSGDAITTFIPNQEVNAKININNSGSVSTGNMNAVLSSGLVDSGVLKIINATSTYNNIATYSGEENTTPFKFKLLKSHTGAMPATLTITNSFGKSWEFDFDLNEALPPLISEFDFDATKNQIAITWKPVNNIGGYNIYRCNPKTDNCTNNHNAYKRVNKFRVVGSALFNDDTVDELSEYYYKIAVVTTSGNERAKEQLLTDNTYETPNLAGYQAWTSLNLHKGFPIAASAKRAISPVTVADVNGNGKKELFPTFIHDRDGLIMGFREDGQEMFDIDNNPTTISGFAKVKLPNNMDGGELWSKAAVGDIDNDGSSEVFVSTSGNYYASNRGYLFGYRTKDNNGDGKPDEVWENAPKSLGRRSINAPVLANIDGDVNNTLEIIVRTDANMLKVYDANGTELWSKQPSPTRGPGDILVADLNNDGKKEIIMGTQNNLGSTMGLYIWDYQGNDFAGKNPVYSNGNERFSTSPIAADIDNDGELEIIIVGRQGESHKLYAFNSDGSFVNGKWNGQINLDLPALGDPIWGGIEKTPQPAVGDLNNDGMLEIVFAGEEKLMVFDNLGNNFGNFPITISSLSSGYATSPILADVDDDDDIEIIVMASNDRIYAFNIDGTESVGWRLRSRSSGGFSGAPTIADIDGDGFNEVIANDSEFVTHVWKTTGDADKIEWGSYRGNPQNTGVYKDGCSKDIDLYVKDGHNDSGTEPNRVTQYMWTSKDIWIRTSDDNGLEHQNPIFRADGTPNYIYVRVINRGCIASTGKDSLTVNWAKANTSLDYPQNWDGSLSNSGGFKLGGILPSVTIPIVQPGEEVIVKVPWVVPNPIHYTDNEDPWHFCLLARIDSKEDPLSYPFTTNPGVMVRNNNNQAWKNISIVNVGIDPSSISVMVSNNGNAQRKFNLELKKEANETGKAIYDEAEVSIKMDNTIYTAWSRGGKQMSKLNPTLELDKKLVKEDNAFLKNLILNPNERGLVTLNFNFLTKELTNKAEYTYHLIQRDAVTGEIMGGESYVIRKNPRSIFFADALIKTSSQGQEVTLKAKDIYENAVYNWYDSSGNLIYQGKDLTVDANVVAKYRLEIVADADGYKDYAEVDVKLKPNKIESITPNPTSGNITVNYKANGVSSAYLMIVSNSGGNISNNYILDTNVNTINLNIANYPLGIYSVALVCNGNIVDVKTLVKQ